MVGEMSTLAILTKCPLAKCPLAKCPLAKCRLAKCPLAKCHGFEVIDQAHNVCVCQQTQGRVVDKTLKLASLWDGLSGMGDVNTLKGVLCEDNTIL